MGEGEEEVVIGLCILLVPLLLSVKVTTIELGRYSKGVGLIFVSSDAYSYLPKAPRKDGGF